MIKNVRGHHNGLGVNHYDRGRKGNKVSLIVTREGVPLNMRLVGSNVHDIKVLDEQISGMNVKVVGSRLIGDKGYNSKYMKDKLMNKGVELIYPYKKNQKEKNNNEERDLLKKRNIIENVFSWIQNRRRIRLRYESNEKYYIELYHLCLIEVIMRKGII